MFSNLFLNSGTFVITPYAFSGFDFITSQLSLFQTLPTAHDLLQRKNSNSHTLPCCVSRCRKISLSVPYQFINPYYSCSGTSGASPMWEIMSQTIYSLTLILLQLFICFFYFYFLKLLIKSPHLLWGSCVSSGGITHVFSGHRITER